MIHRTRLHRMERSQAEGWNRWAILGITWLVCALMASGGRAQDLFELVAPGISGVSLAQLSQRELIVQDAAGQTTVYQRLTRYDTPDGAFIGYGSREAQRVIQWPTNNAGNMRIGNLRNGQIEFAPSRMSVRPAGANPGNGVGIAGPNRNPNVPGGFGNPMPAGGFPDPGNGQLGGAQGVADNGLSAVQLSSGDGNNRVFLRSSRNGQIAFTAAANDADSAWYIVPVGQDMVRLQQNVGNRWLALGVDPNGFPNQGAPGAGIGGARFGGIGIGGNGIGGNGASVRFAPIGQSIQQLWRIQPCMGGGYTFESVWMPGYGLTCVPNSGLWLQPFVNNPWQVWWAQTPVFQVPVPQYRTTAEQIVPNPPLPPVTLRIANTHTDGILVLLADRRNPQQPLSLRIPAGGSETVTLERDAGGTVIQTIELMDGFGNIDRQEYQIPVPPAVLYDISIYEEFLQSIAIDRTGKSPNPIEDVNYQPRSVGFFLLPAGAAIEDNSVIDAYRAAADSQNPGAVRRLNPKNLPNSSSQAPARDPLKDLLQQFQGKRGAY